MPNKIVKCEDGQEIIVGNGKANDIRNIAFEVITDKYSWGHYGDFRVIIDNDNGYINATELCKQGGKKIN